MASAEDITVSLAGGLPLKKIRLGVMTWNVGNASPGDEWVSTAFPKGGFDFDMIVIGMQESTFSMSTVKNVNIGASGQDSSPTRKPAATDSASTAHGNLDTLAPSVTAVRESIEKSLPDFVTVKHCRRVQMQLYVLVRKPLMQHVSNIQFAVENTGFFSIFPNKGGVLLAFELYGTKLSFLSCHLAAHEGVNHCEMRNNSIKEILTGVRLSNYDDRFDISSTSHHMFWMGDMNYRLTNDPTLPKASKRNEAMTEERKAELKELKDLYDAKDAEEDAETEISGSQKLTSNSPGKDAKKDALNAFKVTVRKLLLENNWSALLEYDELNREIRDNRALNGFTALQPCFPPTFKRKRHVDISDTKNIVACPHDDNAAVEEQIKKFYDPKRIPSFTDRILHRSMPQFKKNLEFVKFRSFENITTSDHKPVQATFNLFLTHGTNDISVPSHVQDYLNHKAISKLIKEKQGIELVISEMRCKDLAEMDVELGFGMGGGSDPYIVVSADPASVIATKRALRSTTIKHNLNPVWPDDETIRVPIVTNDLQGLARNAHLMLSVWDYDFSNDDDLIGVCRIPFATIIEAFKSGKKFAFEEDVYDNGEIQGKICGKIAVTGMYSKVQEAFEASKGSAVTLSKIKIPDSSDLFGCCSLA